MAKFGVGQPVRRVEDQRFITGGGRYTDDIDLAGPGLWLRRALARGARPHRVDRRRGGESSARRAGGDHRRRDRGRPAATRCPARSRWRIATAPRACNPLRPVLCTERVRHVGDHVAFVVAETLEPGQGCGRADRGRVRIAARRSTDTETAADAGRPWCTTTCPANLAFDWEYGDRGRGRGGARRRAHVTRLRIDQQPPGRQRRSSRAPRSPSTTPRRRRSRCMPAPRAAGCSRDIAGRRAQGRRREGPRPDARRRRRLRHEGVLLSRVRAWRPGRRAQLGRPVKWTGERSETFLSDVMGRDHVTEAELALRRRPQDPRHAGRDHRQHGRLQLAVRAVHPDRRGAQGPARRLRRQEPGLPGQGRAHQHHAGRRLSRRRPAGIDLSDGAAGGRRGARGRRGSGRVPAQELHRAPPRCRSRPRPARSTIPASSPGSWTPRSKQADWAGFARRKARGRGGAACGAASAWRTTSNRPWATRRRRRAIKFEDDGTVERRGRHPVERPGPRDRLRAGAATTASACRSRRSASSRATPPSSSGAAAPAARAR